jgi:hypothetical protein
VPIQKSGGDFPKVDLKKLHVRNFIKREKKWQHISSKLKITVIQMGRVGKSCDDWGIRRCTHYVQLVIDEEIKGLMDFPGVWAIQCPMAYLKKDSYFWLGWKKLKDRQVRHIIAICRGASGNVD